MIRVDVEQGSAEWLQARLGIPTASQFHRILTPKTMKLSGQAAGYRNELPAEWFLGEPNDAGRSEFMARGNDMEDEAVKWYEFERNVTVDRVGFCLTDDKQIGCSPDGLVGDDGGLEIKIQSASNHVGSLLTEDDEQHRCQIQGGLYVTGRQWWDRLYYHPTLPSVVRRMERDDEFINPLEVALTEFLCDFGDCRQALLSQGCVRIVPKPTGAHCTARRDDERFCMSRVELVDTPAGWRCDQHSSVGKIVEEAWKQYA